MGIEHILIGTLHDQNTIGINTSNIIDCV